MANFFFIFHALSFGPNLFLDQSFPLSHEALSMRGNQTVNLPICHGPRPLLAEYFRDPLLLREL